MTPRGISPLLTSVGRRCRAALTHLPRLAQVPNQATTRSRRTPITNNKFSIFNFQFPSILSWLLLALSLRAADAPSPTRGQVSYPHYRESTNGRVLDALITGENASTLPGGWVQLEAFEMRGFQNGQTNDLQFTAQSSRCRIQTTREIACDDTALVIFTPSNHLRVQGVGYYCAQTNQVLILSNQVETTVVKSFLGRNFFTGVNTNSRNEPDQLLKIASHHGEFDYRADLVRYTGDVRVADPQFALRSPFLNVQFTNGETLQFIHAWDGVTIDLPLRGQATGDDASYFPTNGAQLLELDGHAHWQNGNQSAEAAQFQYDPNRHSLVADGGVHVRWPVGTNAAGLVLVREIFADHATLQTSPDGQFVDEVNATGNVIIVNQNDHSRSMGALAYYNRTNDIFELKPQADWWNDQMEVTGDTLSASPSNHVERAVGHAYVRRHLSDAHGSTNRLLDLTADDIIAATNLITIRGHARATLLDGTEWQDKLAADLLLVSLDSNNQIQSIDARGNVQAETAPDPRGVKKTITARQATAEFWPGGSLLRTVTADGQVVLDSSAADPRVFSDHLESDHVAAQFSSTTNVMESAVADGAVAFRQLKNAKTIQATGDHGTFALDPDETFAIAGHPWARNDEREVTDADRLEYSARTGQMKVFGRYHIGRVASARKP